MSFSSGVIFILTLSSFCFIPHPSSPKQPQLHISLAIRCPSGHFHHLGTAPANDGNFFDELGNPRFTSAFWALIKNHHSKSPHSSKIATDAIVKVPAVNKASTSSPQTIANPLHSANSAAIFTIISSILLLLSSLRVHTAPGFQAGSFIRRLLHAGQFRVAIQTPRWLDRPKVSVPLLEW